MSLANGLSQKLTKKHLKLCQKEVILKVGNMLLYFLQLSKIFSVDDENGSIFNGAIFYGTENYENFFIDGGNNIVYAGGGDDLVYYKNGNSKDKKIKKKYKK